MRVGPTPWWELPRPKPLPHEIRRLRELAYWAGVPLPPGVESWSRPQIQWGIVRLTRLGVTA